jgi:glc operon protein GlcG
LLTPEHSARAITSSQEFLMRAKHSLTSADVKKIMAACEAEAAKNNWAVAISIVDDGGHLLRFQRMEGAPLVATEVSMGKARTSAMTKLPSKFFEERIKERPAFVGFFPAGSLIQGGLPLIHDNECVGAIGVSGVQSHEDELIAQAGVGALGQ